MKHFSAPISDIRREYCKDIVSRLEHTWQRLQERKKGIPLQLPKIEQNQLPADCGHPLR